MEDIKAKSSPNVIVRILRAFLIAIAAFVVVGMVVLQGIMPRMKAEADLRSETTYAAVPTVAVGHPRRGAPSEEIVLPATLKPYIDAPIYARTNGYLKSWSADIGAHVKAGQLLAEIETPEIDRQVQQARADMATAEANLHLAQTTAVRYTDLLKSDSVSKQEVDSVSGDFEAKKAVVQSTQANVKRLEELQSFQKIYAPFDGVITARNTDIGALIDSGGNSKELFHIASTDKMRVYVSVPQVYSREAKPGLVADLTLREFPGKTFKARLTTTAQAIDSGSRTLLTEFEAPNPSGELLPGAYVEIHIHLKSQAPTLILPVTTLLFRSEGLRVGVVHGNRAELVPVTLGRDFGNEVEVSSGIEPDDLVIVNPPDSLVSNQEVRIVQPDKESPK